MLMGVAILFDLSDGALSVVLDTFAVFLVVEGLVEIVAATSIGLTNHWLGALRGGAFLLAGFLVFNVPWDGNIGAAMVFGVAFLCDGLFRIGSAFVVHGPRWRFGILAGLIEVVLAGAILTSWPVPHMLTVPFCFALLLLTSGYGMIRLALPLRRLPEGGSVTLLPLYATRNWQGGGTFLPAISDEQPWRDSEEPLNVYVWTAAGSIKDPRRRVLVDRYIAAVDKNGVISTGHAALELTPDLYISHYPANEIDHSPSDFRSLLSAEHENDVPGKFNTSLEQEAAAWCMPDQKVTFRNFNARALRAFWNAYSENDTYNLTARNCSTSVIQALDAAVEGACYTGHLARDFLRIVTNPQFWLLRLVRGRAEAMTWTPGLVLDYARLLLGTVEHSDRRWRSRLHAAIQARREFSHVAEAKENKAAAQ